jgi:CheY-like chemotaxis protein
MKVPSLQAENGQIAIDVYKKNLPQVVLMDIEMPVKTGFEASIGIRAYEKEANLPPCLIWAVTAKSDDVSKVYGMESCGIDKWFTKVSIFRMRRGGRTSTDPKTQPLRLSKLEDLIRSKFDIMV